MPSIQVLQISALLLFGVGATLYYNIRRTLHRWGYPVSLFVYSGECWSHYRDLIAKSDAPQQRRLMLKKHLMSLCLISALIILLISGFIPVETAAE
jgi:hypothetical protein